MWRMAGSMSDRRRDKAFTLVEILVALAIISMIVTMVYGSYAATTRSLDVYNCRMTCSGQADLVLRLMARQIRCAYAPPAPARPTQPSAFSGQPGPQFGNSSVPGAAWGTAPAFFQGDSRDARGEILRLLTTGGFSPSPDRPGGLSRISYRYEAQDNVLAICWQPCAGPFEQPRGTPVWHPVLSGVTGIELEFHDGQQWQPRWTSGPAGKLPGAVRVTLTVVDESGRTHNYRTAAPVACRAAAHKPSPGL
jgi:prepilin-type N-terminal cleavage/methylation domain-containing protein